jgi:hypothetical protein
LSTATQRDANFKSEGGRDFAAPLIRATRPAAAPASTRGHGIGAFSLATEAIAASQLGFTKIVANAANHPDAGWVVWPKLGYDAVVENDVLQKMQSELDTLGIGYVAGHFRISDLWESGHYYLWEKHGAGCIMEFDVSSFDSWSMRRIAEIIGNGDK